MPKICPMTIGCTGERTVATLEECPTAALSERNAEGITVFTRKRQSVEAATGFRPLGSCGQFISNDRTRDKTDKPQSNQTRAQSPCAGGVCITQNGTPYEEPRDSNNITD
jgi:hypothetical protein